MQPTTSEPPSGRPHPNLAEREALFLAHLPVIDRIAASVARRLDAAEREDFVARVRLKLIEKDYAVLARFEGRSRLTTYLTCVVRRQFLDEQVRTRGRFRPSLRARRAGTLAVRAEALVTRDGFTRDEALAVLRDSATSVAGEALAALIDAAPPHVSRRVPRALPVADSVACDGGVEQIVRGRQLAVDVRRARRALGAAFAELTPGERALLRARFVEGHSLAGAAQALELDSRRLYPRFTRLLARMRATLAREGLTRDDARALLDGAAQVDPQALALDWCARPALSACVGPASRAAWTARGAARRERSGAVLRAA